MRAVRLAAVESIEPYRQGNLDALCSLYALINAIRLAHDGQLTVHAEKRLFRLGLEFLHTRRILRVVATNGLAAPQFVAMAHHLASHAKATPIRIITYKGGRSASLRHALQWVTAQLKKGRPVLVELKGAYNHYSVVVGINERSLDLFDSIGYRWIEISSCSIGNARVRRRHHINHAAMFVVCRAYN